MRNVKYVVSFEVNPLLDGDFDFKEEALAWAKEHLDNKPIVKAIDIEYSDEFGSEPIIHEEEEIFHYSVEDEPVKEEDDLDARLAKLENDIPVDLFDADEFDGHENLTEVIKSNTPTRAIQYEFTDYDDKGNLTKAAKNLDNVAVKVGEASAAYDSEDAKKIRQEYEKLEADFFRTDRAVQDVRKELLAKYYREFNYNPDGNHTWEETEKVYSALYDDELYKAADAAREAASKACLKFKRDHMAEILGTTPFGELEFDDAFEKAQRASYKNFQKLSATESLEEIPEKHEEPIEEDFVLFDPFGCDFSECEPMEVCPDEHRADCCKDFSINAVDFFKELAAELGLEDEVEIKPVEGECENCEPEVSEVSDEVKVEEPVGEVPPTEVPVEIPTEDPVVTDEQGVEAPAEEITKCEVCPECGKEICDGEECKDCKEEDKPLEEAKEEDIVTPGVKCEQTLEYAEDGENVNKEDKVITYDEDQKKDLEKLDEASHPQEAQPIVDNVKAFNIALEIAKRANKPVIYGYFGPNHHGESRYYEIPHVVCDDLAKCTKDVMNQYHPNGSVLVAYPDKEFVEEGLDEELALNEIFGWSEHEKLDKLFAAKQYKVKGVKEDETREEHNFKTYKDAAKWCSVFTKNPNNKAAYIYVDETEFRKYITDPTIKALEVYTNGQVNKSRIEDVLKKSKELADKNKAAEKSDKKLDRINKKAVDEVSELEDEPKVDETPKAKEPKAEEPKVEETPAETPKKGSKGSIANSRNIKIKKSLAAAGIDVSGLDKEKINALRKELFGEALEEDEEVPNSELENKELFVEEAEEEMSDLELAEKLDAALKELNQK